MSAAKTTLRLIGLTRKSSGKDKGTHESQAANIERRVAVEPGLTLVRIEREHEVSGGDSWRERELGQALKDIEAGLADGVIVDEVDRLTRERMSQAGDIWDAFEKVGAILLDCKGTDSRDEDGEFNFGLNALLARKQYAQYVRRSNAGRARAVEMGVHGGDSAPLGYEFSERADGSTNVKGAAKHGPLVPVEPAASRVREAFARFGAVEGWASWSEIIRLLGLRSLGNARSVLTNRVYLGEAKSGDYVKPGAHPALVTEDIFDRVQFRLGEQSETYASRVRAPRTALALAKVLRCPACGSVLTPDRTKRGERVYISWRCNRARTTLGLCTGMGSVSDAAILEFAVGSAQAWHAAAHPTFMLGIAADDATRPALEDALRDARRALDEAEAMVGVKLPAESTQAQAVAKAQADIRAHEASRGWIARTPEEVAVMIESGNVEALNTFLRETVRIIVQPGPGRHASKEARAVENRVKVLYLDHGRTASDEEPETFIPLPEVATVAG